METTRDLEERWDELSLEQKKAELKRRRQVADDYLRPRLKAGDRLRASKAECNAREASFTFSHWEGGWIVSVSGRSISPGAVYSLNGNVLRF